MMDRADKVAVTLFGMVVATILGICVCCVIADISTAKYNSNLKCEYGAICIGGYQYELVVNEFNEPVWCGEKLPADSPIDWEIR